MGTLKRYLGITSSIDLYYRVATGVVTENDVARCFGKAKPEPKMLFLEPYKHLFDDGNGEASPAVPSVAEGSSGAFLLDQEYEQLPTVLATCCKPVHGDQVVGIVDGGRIMVHRTNCKKAMDEMASHENRIVRAKWRTGERLSFLTGIALTAIDRRGLLQDITRIISNEMNLNIRAITIEASEGVGRGIVMLYVHDTENIKNLIDQIEKIDGIESVKRI